MGEFTNSGLTNEDIITRKEQEKLLIIAKYYCKKYSYIHLPLDDMYSQVCYSFIKAKQNFKENQNVKFESYFSRILERDMFAVSKKEYKYSSCTSFEDYKVNNEDLLLTEETMDYDENDYTAKTILSYVKSHYKDDEFKMIVFWMHGLNYTQISKTLGIKSRKTVSDKIEKILSDCKVKFN